MSMSSREEEAAVEWVRKNRSPLIKRFAEHVVPASKTKIKDPVSLFMAGSPGAGKTEFSKRFIQMGEKEAVRMDTDEIRTLLPGYTGLNAYKFQYPASLGIEKIHDHCLAKKKHFIFDSTFSNYERAETNIIRSINKARAIQIIYIYQDPAIAWMFTKKRERLENRSIPPEAFIKEFFGAQSTVNKIKKKFGNQVRLYLVEKNGGIENPNLFKLFVNVQDIDSHIKIVHSMDSLSKIVIE